MAIQITNVGVPGPGTLLGAARAVLHRTARVATLLLELPERLASLLDGIDRLLARIADLVERVDRLVGRVDTIAADAAAIVATADAVAGGAAGVLERAGRVTGEADRIAEAAALVLTEAADLSLGAESLLATYRPLAERAAPLADAFVAGLTEREVASALSLLRALPDLTENLETRLMPLAGHLDGVGPDVHELVTVVKDLRQAINSVPGLAYLRRRMP